VVELAEALIDAANVLNSETRADGLIFEIVSRA